MISDARNYALYSPILDAVNYNILDREAKQAILSHSYTAYNFDVNPTNPCQHLPLSELTELTELLCITERDVYYTSTSQKWILMATVMPAYNSTTRIPFVG